MRLNTMPPQPGQVQAASWVMVSRGRCGGSGLQNRLGSRRLTGCPASASPAVSRASTTPTPLRVRRSATQAARSRGRASRTTGRSARGAASRVAPSASRYEASWHGSRPHWRRSRYPCGGQLCLPSNREVAQLGGVVRQRQDSLTTWTRDTRSRFGVGLTRILLRPAFSQPAAMGLRGTSGATIRRQSIASMSSVTAPASEPSYRPRSAARQTYRSRGAWRTGIIQCRHNTAHTDSRPACHEETNGPKTDMWRCISVHMCRAGLCSGVSRNRVAPQQ